MKIILATSNRHKLSEYQKILSDYQIITLPGIGFTDEIEENGRTFTENAMIKARAIYDFLAKPDCIIVAEDSGLVVDALDGAPGILSARYAGGHGNDVANRAKLLQELSGKTRDAKFVCAIAIIYPDGHNESVIGETFGEITATEQGDGGFAYDSIFFSQDLNKTFGEASEEEKNRVSHRGRAIKQLRERLEKYSNNINAVLRRFYGEL